MSSPAPLFELDCVDYRQGEVAILRQASWRLLPGERWAVLGPNGGGKTTLLRLAAGYLWPSAGVVRRSGAELSDLRELRRTIGWVAADLAASIPEDEPVLATVVSGRFAQLGLKPYDDFAPTAADWQAAREALARAECDCLAEKPFGVLSQGERQQVLVARAQAVEPVAVVLDEPCAGMDPGVRERFLAWLDRHAQASTACALVLVTHHVEEIMPCFDNTLAIADGRIVAAGPTRDLISRELLEQLYRVEVARLDHHAGRLWPVWGAASR